MNPIMMGRKFLHEKIEHLYSAQFSAILRQKNMNALDLSKVIRKELKKQFKNTPNYWVQSLANLIYSCHKFSQDHAEISYFLRFLKSYKSFEFLFYLYIRQQFINFCKLSFINQLKSPKDFKAFKISKSKAIKILQNTLSENPESLKNALESFQAKYKSKQNVQFYEFLIFCLDIDINHTDLDILEKIIEFYCRRPKIQSPSVRTNTYVMLDQINQEDFESIHTLEVNPEETIQTKLMNPPRTNQRYQTNEETTNFPQIAQQLYPSQSERNHKRRSEFPKLELRQAYGKNLKEKEMMLTETIKVLLREEITKMLDNFVKTFHVKNKETDIICKSLFDLILSKCKTILTMIFFQNRKRFFNLIRKNPKKEKALVEIWEELANMYEYFKKQEVTSQPVLRQFVKRCLMFPTLEEEILFLLQYMFKVRYNY
jgi:hypothetical protein